MSSIEKLHPAWGRLKCEAPSCPGEHEIADQYEIEFEGQTSRMCATCIENREDSWAPDGIKLSEVPNSVWNQWRLTVAVKDQDPDEVDDDSEPSDYWNNE